MVRITEAECLLGQNRMYKDVSELPLLHGNTCPAGRQVKTPASLCAQGVGSKYCTTGDRGAAALPNKSYIVNRKSKFVLPISPCY